MSNALINLHAKLISSAFDFRQEREGAVALEYMAIVVGLIVAVAALFLIFGGELKDKGLEQLRCVLNRDCNPS